MVTDNTPFYYKRKYALQHTTQSINITYDSKDMKNCKKLSFSDDFRTIVKSIEKHRSYSLSHLCQSLIDYEYILNVAYDTIELGRFGYVKINNIGEVKIGRIIRKLANIMGKSFSDDIIEIFVNHFKAYQTSVDIQIVSGDQIQEYYKKKYHYNYGGCLTNSCMNDADFLDIYTKNPEVCNLLIIPMNKDGVTKIAARALLWKLDPNLHGITHFLDRIYCNDDFYRELIIRYAISQNWAYKNDRNKITYKESFIYSDMGELSIKINKLKYEKFPYMDTFTRYDYKRGVLFNDKFNDHPGYILNGLHGEFLKTRKSLSFFARLCDIFN